VDSESPAQIFGDDTAGIQSRRVMV
jgi:hypothetical protein